MKSSDAFAPHGDIARTLLPHAIDAADDASHDLSHVLRVWKNVQDISAREGGAGDTLVAATLLHDCVAIPKDSPSRSVASRLSADHALRLLKRLGWPDDKAASVGHAIEAHSFSAGVTPRTMEAKILQDADRLDAIGYIGIARCFYVSGRLGRALYDPADPLGSERDLDDARFAIDHFQTKLLKLSQSFQTQTGRALARERHDVVQQFFDRFVSEVS
ncbi:MAG: HD domain-containing protein [Pseudomonadota bacterium]